MLTLVSIFGFDSLSEEAVFDDEAIIAAFVSTLVRKVEAESAVAEVAVGPEERFDLIRM